MTVPFATDPQGHAAPHLLAVVGAQSVRSPHELQARFQEALQGPPWESPGTATIPQESAYRRFWHERESPAAAPARS